MGLGVRGLGGVGGRKQGRGQAVNVGTNWPATQRAYISQFWGYGRQLSRVKGDTCQSFLGCRLRLVSEGSCAAGSCLGSSGAEASWVVAVSSIGCPLAGLREWRLLKGSGRSACSRLTAVPVEACVA